MLYVGATLMIGASIYGFVDYKQTHNKKEFREMYAEEKKVTPVVIETKKAEKTPEPSEKVTATPAKKEIIRKKNEIKDEVIESVQPVNEADKMVTTDKNITNDKPLTIEPSKESSIIKIVKKKRKVRKEIFSRAPLRDEEVLIAEPVKKETPKTESKQQ